MTNKQWVKSQLELMEIKSLTEEQRKEARLNLNSYLRMKEETKTNILNLQQEISQLEEGLMQDIPTTTHGIYIHSGISGCGLKAVFPLGKDEEINTFYCMFCEKDFQLGPDNPDKISTKDPIEY